MTDRLIIRDLVASCRIGVHEWERATPQQVWIDLEVAIDAAKAAAHDDMRDALDYGRLVTVVTQHVERWSFHLLETFAEELAALILATFAVPEVRVRIKKRALPGIDHAAVEIVRTAATARPAAPRA